MKCRDATLLMHTYFDEEIDHHSQKLLTQHLKECLSCKEHFDELKETDRLLKVTQKLKASSKLTDEIINRTFPNKKRDAKFKEWLVKHPFAASAAIFVLLMSISFANFIDQGNEPIRIVNGNSNDIIVEGDKVIVPEDKNVVGDLVVENGSVEIKGKVDGNVTVVNGKIFMANVTQVNGKTEQVDQVFEWVWFKLKTLLHSF